MKHRVSHTIPRVFSCNSWSHRPGAMGIDGELEVTLASGATAAGTIIEGRPCLQVTFDTTDAVQTNFQDKTPVYYAAAGDKLFMKASVRFDATFHDDLGLFIGWTTADTTAFADAVASLPDDAIGIHKTIAGTDFNLVAVDDNATPSTTALGLTLAAETWYDFFIEVERTAANTARMTVWAATDTPYGQSIKDQDGVKMVTWETTQLPDDGTVLLPTISGLGNTTNAIIHQIANWDYWSGGPG